MHLDEPDRHKRKQKRHFSNVMHNEKQEGALSPGELAGLGISAEEYEQDQQARQLLALARGKTLDEHPAYPTRPRVRINQDSFGTLEGRKIERQQPSEPYMASNSNPMEGVESTGQSLGREGLAGRAQLVAPAEDLPPQYEEGSFTFYQVVTRPCSQVPAGSYYSYSHLRHHEGGPRQEILNLVWEALFKLDVNMEVVQPLEDEAGYCFPLHSSRKPPFQTREWQNMVEVRKLSEDDNTTWETITSFEESALVKLCKVRAQERLNKQSSSGTEASDGGPSAGGDNANNNVVGEPPKGEQGTRETVIVSQEIDPDKP